jgi:hypothetical protein
VAGNGVLNASTAGFPARLMHAAFGQEHPSVTVIPPTPWQANTSKASSIFPLEIYLLQVTYNTTKYTNELHVVYLRIQLQEYSY